MNLTTATAPKKEKIPLIQRKVVKQGATKLVDTGKKHIIEIEDAEGKITKRKEPIYEKQFIGPVFEDKEIMVDRWIVETTYKDKTERHEFANATDAKNFYKGFSK